jgi:hypothetical protein
VRAPDFATRMLTVSRTVVQVHPRFHPGDGRFLVKPYPKDKEYRRFKLSTRIAAKLQAHVVERGLGRDDLLMESDDIAAGLLVSNGNEARASDALGHVPGGDLPEDPRVQRRSGQGSDQAEVRADAERAIVTYQQPPVRFSAPRTRKKAAHP